MRCLWLLLLLILSVLIPSRPAHAQSGLMREVRVLAYGLVRDRSEHARERELDLAGALKTALAKQFSAINSRLTLIQPDNEERQRTFSEYLLGDPAKQKEHRMPSFGSTFGKGTPHVVLLVVQELPQSGDEIYGALQGMIGIIHDRAATAKIVLFVRAPYGRDDVQVDEKRTTKDWNAQLEVNRQNARKAAKRCSGGWANVDVIDLSEEIGANHRECYEQQTGFWLGEKGINLEARSIAERIDFLLKN